MHSKLPVICCLGFLTYLAPADETVRIVGPIADGTPAAAAPAAPRLDIAPEDVLETKVHSLGERQVIVQKVAPIELPAWPEPMPAQRPAARGEAPQIPVAAETPQLLLLSATVYHIENQPPRTLFRWRSADQQREFTAWSNADGNWLGGFTGFEASGTRYSLLLFASNLSPTTPPQILELPAGDPAFVVTQGNPTPQELAPLTALHQLLKTDGETLRLAYEGREQARLAREANPPPKKDIVLHYWRVPKAAPSSDEGGGQ